jgi:hypothetical protein
MLEGVGADWEQHNRNEQSSANLGDSLSRFLYEQHVIHLKAFTPEKFRVGIVAESMTAFLFSKGPTPEGVTTNAFQCPRVNSGGSFLSTAGRFIPLASSHAIA